MAEEIQVEEIHVQPIAAAVETTPARSEEEEEPRVLAERVATRDAHLVLDGHIKCWQ